MVEVTDSSSVSTTKTPQTAEFFFFVINFYNDFGVKSPEFFTLKFLGQVNCSGYFRFPSPNFRIQILAFFRFLGDVPYQTLFCEILKTQYDLYNSSLNASTYDYFYYSFKIL